MVIVLTPISDKITANNDHKLYRIKQPRNRFIYSNRVGYCSVCHSNIYYVMSILDVIY